ncbi:HAD family hydrolase [Aureibaculum sp. A20]|uniref:phosphoglycolate phosphatase n=1 Tax=Aureibaculum flavum TaxID=2795986 RepID=A0ABS0WP74_9FLAO|nr:HAD family hydrolase [Aureibaculum flavum]MBJ2173780.1 HAD family hydrolase [Aureibaculum flavum]
MNFKGVLFDLDGTLVNSLEDIANAMNSVLSQCNYPTHTLVDYKSFTGKGILSLVEVSLPKTAQNKETIASCMEQFLTFYSENCTVNTKPYDGIMELLDELKSRQLKLAVFSNKADDFTKKIVEALLPGYFSIVAGLKIEAHKKPNPLVALQICEQLNIKPQEAIYVGDTNVDMQTATNADLYGVGVLWGFRTKEELMASGAKQTLNHPLDLIQSL